MRGAMSAPRVVVFVIGGDGHVARILALVWTLTETGVEAWVFSECRYQAEVRRAGGRFADLYAGRPLDLADGSSRPIPCRYVTFAGIHTEELVAEVAAIRPALILADSFAAIGSVVARLEAAAVRAQHPPQCRRRLVARASSSSSRTPSRRQPAR
jgi:hypothetical protein